MKISIFLSILALFISLSTDFISNIHASDLKIGRMRVAIWPEYDDPGILGIYDGRFVDNGNFPTETTFLLPKGAIISDACSLSPKGQHFCQLFKLEEVGDVSVVKLKLPFPNFYLSFHYKSFDGKDTLRNFNYDLKTTHEIDKLIIDIQEPLRAEGFKIDPASEDTEDIRDFNHHRYTFREPAKGKAISFKISYKKEDNRPSVNIKYSPMSNPFVMTSPYDERGKFVTLIYVAAGAGLLLLSIMVYYLFRKKKKS